MKITTSASVSQLQASAPVPVPVLLSQHPYLALRYTRDFGNAMETILSQVRDLIERRKGTGYLTPTQLTFLASYDEAAQIGLHLYEEQISDTSPSPSPASEPGSGLSSAQTRALLIALSQKMHHLRREQGKKGVALAHHLKLFTDCLVAKQGYLSLSLY